MPKWQNPCPLGLDWPESNLNPAYNIFMSAFFTGLSALTHPAALSAIALLLLNDHVFKHDFPSMLTGKISDFAGLLFFPLLLSALIGLLEHRPRRAAVWGFALTGLVFAALKLYPPVASWASAALGRLLGANVWITPDPTDLSALIMLLPAWRLWASAPNRQYDRRLGYAALVVGTLASVATSPTPPINAIIRLSQMDGIIYAYGDQGVIFKNNFDSLFLWTTADNIPDPIETELRTSVILPKVVCSQHNPELCYRIGVKNLEVETTVDGGGHWKTEWKIPSGRLFFMQRIGSNFTSDAYSGPFDLLITPQDDIVAALGKEGVLVRENGEWKRTGVDQYNRPKPFKARDFSEAMDAIMWETLASIILGLLFFAMLTVWAASMAIRMHHGNKFWLFFKIYSPLWIFAAGVGIVLVLMMSQSLEMEISLALLVLFGIGLIFSPIMIWWTASRYVIQSGVFRRAGGVAFGYSIWIALVILITFLAWALGFPPFYWMAFGVALALCTWIGTQGILKTMRSVQISLQLRSITKSENQENDLNNSFTDE